MDDFNTTNEDSSVSGTVTGNDTPSGDGGNVWSKVSCPERLSVTGPKALNGEQNAYRDVIPFARRIVETFPDRVLWGTDWPHPNVREMPDDGKLVDLLPLFTSDASLMHKLLIDNPTRLYWYD